MSNTYFQFKQFIIHQQNCAMKVCTDACLFGAWIAGKVGGGQMAVDSVLDIGTGTGLLGLMIAQRSNAKIDAVELDEPAAQQAAENFELSNWREKLQVIQGDIRTVHLGKNYDLIISNPPFFENDLKSPDAQRNLALHSQELGLDELLATVKKQLTDNGKFAVLLPYHRKETFIKLALGEGFFVEEETSVKQTPSHNYFRIMFLFGKEPIATKRESIVIRDGEQYTSEFTDLLKDYYLKL
ncbi:MAG: methyltransferase [Bacteroidota bacterium]